MPTKRYRLKITPQAEKDRERVEKYAVELETSSRRMVALGKAVLSLKSNWHRCPFFDRECGIRVCYIEGWYSVFFTVDEPADGLSFSPFSGRPRIWKRCLHEYQSLKDKLA